MSSRQGLLDWTGGVSKGSVRIRVPFGPPRPLDWSLRIGLRDTKSQLTLKSRYRYRTLTY